MWCVKGEVQPEILGSYSAALLRGQLGKTGGVLVLRAACFLAEGEQQGVCHPHSSRMLVWSRGLLSPCLRLQTFRSAASCAAPFRTNTMRQDPPGCYDFSPKSGWNASRVDDSQLTVWMVEVDTVPRTDEGRAGPGQQEQAASGLSQEFVGKQRRLSCCGEDGVDEQEEKLSESSSWPEGWAAVHESIWRIRMVFVTFDMPLASMVSSGPWWETAEGFYPHSPPGSLSGNIYFSKMVFF